MTKIVVIVAIAQNGVIGRKKDIPWRLSQDFQRFKKLTMGSPCIMGDVTYESLPETSRPLPGRENIILTFDHDYHPEGTRVFYSFDDAIGYVKKKDIENYGNLINSLNWFGNFIFLAPSCWSSYWGIKSTNQLFNNFHCFRIDDNFSLGKKWNYY